MVVCCLLGVVCCLLYVGCCLMLLVNVVRCLLCECGSLLVVC